VPLSWAVVYWLSRWPQWQSVEEKDHSFCADAIIVRILRIVYQWLFWDLASTIDHRPQEANQREKISIKVHDNWVGPFCDGD
jgi:hypothetical protein